MARSNTATTLPGSPLLPYCTNVSRPSLLCRCHKLRFSFAFRDCVQKYYLRDQKRGAGVDGDDLIEAVRGNVHEVFEHTDPGVVDQNVQAAASPLHGLSKMQGRRKPERRRTAPAQRRKQPARGITGPSIGGKQGTHGNSCRLLCPSAPRLA